MGITPLAWKQHCQFCTDWQSDPLLLPFSITHANTWNWSLAHCVPRFGSPSPWNFDSSLPPVEMAVKAKYHPAVLFCRWLCSHKSTQIHRSFATIRVLTVMLQHCTDESAVSQLLLSPFLSTARLIYGEVSHHAVQSHHHSSQLQITQTTVTKLLLLIYPTEENLKWALLTTTVGVWYLPTHFYRSGCQVSLLSENVMC